VKSYEPTGRHSLTEFSPADTRIVSPYPLPRLPPFDPAFFPAQRRRRPPIGPRPSEKTESLLRGSDLLTTLSLNFPFRLCVAHGGSSTSIPTRIFLLRLQFKSLLNNFCRPVFFRSPLSPQAFPSPPCPSVFFCVPEIARTSVHHRAPGYALCAPPL